MRSVLLGFTGAAFTTCFVIFLLLSVVNKAHAGEWSGFASAQSTPRAALILRKKDEWSKQRLAAVTRGPSPFAGIAEFAQQMPVGGYNHTVGLRLHPGSATAVIGVQSNDAARQKVLGLTVGWKF